MAPNGGMGERKGRHFQPARPFHRRYGAGAFPDALYPQREGFPRGRHPDPEPLVRMIV